MLVFYSLLVLLTIGDAEEIRTNDFEIRIEEGALESLKQLKSTEKLDLSNRNIEYIREGAFSNVSVKFLNLQSNKLVILEPDTFSGLRAEDLIEINLGSNILVIIDSAFAGMKNLKLVNVSDNLLSDLTASEFFGIPHTADILVKANPRVNALRPGAFEQSHSGEAYEKSKQNSKRFARNEPDRFVESLMELAEQAPIFLLADAITDADDFVPSLQSSGKTFVCVENSILKRVAIRSENETLPKNCVDNVIEPGTRYLQLTDRGIQAVAKGWYQLEKIPISFIDFSRNNLTQLTPELLNNLPQSVKVVDMSENFIREIRKEATRNVHLKGISFRANLIEIVEDGSFESGELIGLYFTDNKISNISFCGSLPASLVQLHINKNQISKILDGIFFSLKNLRQINLSHNVITEISKDGFKGLISLESIDLAHNQISKIEPGAFLDLKKLDMLSLDDNLISSCGNGTFEGLENLTSLSLASNKFTNISKNNFDRFPKSLLSLDLQGNEISDIESGHFEGVPKKTLKLNNNKLSKILSSHFKIDELEDLDLKNNFISEINSDSFQGLPGVKSLSLDGNMITEIPPNTLKHFKALTLFDISRNPITKLKNGALNGIRESIGSEVLIYEHVLEVIQGGIFEDV